MIGMRPSGIRLAATFDEFMVVPPKAWEQCKAALAETAKLYGFQISFDDIGGQPEAYERWFKWMAGDG